MYDISDDDLPHAVVSGLEKKGWHFNASEQEWRLHNDAGPFSPHRMDHLRQWPADVEAVMNEFVKVPGGDQMSSAQVQDSDTLLVEAAKTLFAFDAAKNHYKGSWDTAPQGMKDHFVRLAAKKLAEKPADGKEQVVIEPTGGDLKPIEDGTGYYENTRDDLRPVEPYDDKI